jgi:polysaccharide export outer membrane protein
MSKTSINFVIVLILGIAVQACAHTEPYTWVEDLTAAEQSTAQYRIRPGDELLVSVWNQVQISGTRLVRDDGFITVTLVGELAVVGLTTTEAAVLITKKLEGDILQDVRVNVAVASTAPATITVIGEVREPGQFELGATDSLITVLSRAGGLTEFAKNSNYVLRKNSKNPRVRFDYDRLTTSPTGGMNFRLSDGDIVVVE